ncbi:hypothetical protein BH18THE2_BH18THE2_15400 [soil metagenome]
MNNKMLTIGAVLAAALFAGVFATTPMAAYAGGDYSGTETEQEIKQKNVGSGDSTNVNCAENDIAGVEEVPTELELQLCGTAAVDLGTD